MKLCGLMKTTLLDYPGQVACTVFLGGCDLRCPFCHNSELIDAAAPAALDMAEFLAFLKKRRGLLDGVVVSGGEPLLWDLSDFLTEIRALGYLVKLDTNGTHPERLSGLLERGLLDYVAMDIKNSPERYGETVGLPGFDPSPVRTSVRLLLEGNVDYEFRTTVVAQFHDPASFAGIGAMIQGARRYYLQPFQDRDTVPFAGLRAPARAELEHFLEIVGPYVDSAEIRGDY